MQGTDSITVYEKEKKETNHNYKLNASHHQASGLLTQYQFPLRNCHRLLLHFALVVYINCIYMKIMDIKYGFDTTELVFHSKLLWLIWLMSDFVPFTPNHIFTYQRKKIVTTSMMITIWNDNNDQFSFFLVFILVCRLDDFD